MRILLSIIILLLILLFQYSFLFFSSSTITTTRYSTLYSDLKSLSISYTTDTSQYQNTVSHLPTSIYDLIVFPESADDIREIVRLAKKYKKEVIPMGLNTCIEGQTVSYGNGIVVNLREKMKNVIKVHKEDLQVTVQSGIRISELNVVLKDYGLFFAVSPGSNPTIGGAISTSGSGTQTTKYGTIRENIIRLEVVLPNGKLIKTRSRAVKSSAGYDLTSLFVSAEGTLGIITSATLKVHPIPKLKAAAHTKFVDVEKIINSVFEIKKSNTECVAKMEVLNDVAIKSYNEHFNTTYDEKYHLLFEFHGNSKEEVDICINKVKEIININDGFEFKKCIDEKEIEKMWKLRRSAFFTFVNYFKRRRKDCKDCRIVTTDVCVPISHYSKVVTESIGEFKNHGKNLPFVAHAGDGNFHFMDYVDYSSFEEKELFSDLYHKLISRSISYDGTCTGEHGIGLTKKKALRMEFDDTTIDLMNEIKKAIDPNNIMNPSMNPY